MLVPCKNACICCNLPPRSTSFSQNPIPHLHKIPLAPRPQTSYPVPGDKGIAPSPQRTLPTAYSLHPCLAPAPIPIVFRFRGTIDLSAHSHIWPVFVFFDRFTPTERVNFISGQTFVHKKNFFAKRIPSGSPVLPGIGQGYPALVSMTPPVVNPKRSDASLGSRINPGVGYADGWQCTSVKGA